MRSVVLFVAVLMACSKPESQPQPQCVTTDLGSTVPPFVLGEPYRAVIGKSASLTCQGSTLGFRAELFDESNQPVDGARWTQLGDTPTTLTVELTFTPTSLGPYHYRVQFEPNLTLEQGSIVRAERRQRDVLQTYRLPPGVYCHRGHVTGHGTLVCVGTALHIVRAAGTAQKLEFERVTQVAFAGDTIWVPSKGLERWVDDGTQLVLVPDAGFRTPKAALAATETEGFAADFEEVLHFAVDGGAWLPSESFRVARSLANRRGDVIESDAPGGMSSDGGFWWWAGDTMTCQNPVRPDGGQRCFPSPGSPAQVEADGVWFTGSGAVSFLDEAGSVTTLPISSSFDSAVAPVFRVAGDVVFVARGSDGGLSLELIDGGYSGGWVEGNRLYLTGDGFVNVLPR